MYRLLEALSAELGQDGKVVVGLVVGDVGLFVVQSLELRDLHVKVIAILVKVAPSRGDIGFVLVVRVGYALRRWRATDGPGFEVAIHNCAVDGEEAGEIETHPINLVRGIYELLNGSYTVVGQVVVVGERIQARTWATLVAATWCLPGVSAGDIDLLLSGIKAYPFAVGVEGRSKLLSESWEGKGVLGRAQKCKDRKGSHHGPAAPDPNSVVGKK